MGSSVPETFFAPSERAPREVVLAQRALIERTPVLTDVFDAFPEPAMVLNEQRQIVHANDKLRTLLARSADDLVGRRPGEALACVNADEAGGCGTGHACRYCGAVRAIWESQKARETRTDECRIVRRNDDRLSALDLRVWSRPIELEGERFSIFAVRDTTDEKRRQVLERIFFHDVLNAAGGIKGILDIWPELSASDSAEIGTLAQNLAAQLVDDIEAHRDLAAAERGDLRPRLHDTDVRGLLDRLVALYRFHTAADGRSLALDIGAGPLLVRTDDALLMRVLGNLLKNALEASQPGERVTLRFRYAGRPRFEIHNPAPMPERVQRLMFQRSFSTKEGQGRGIGAYSAKLLTETYLGGRLWFDTSEAEGTTFTVELPASV